MYITSGKNRQQTAMNKEKYENPTTMVKSRE
jgi:hypothetical protein